MAQNEATEKGNPVSTDALAGLYKQYPKDRYNILFPTDTMLELSPLQQLSYEILHIDPKPMTAGGQDVYSIGKKEIGGEWVYVYSFSKTALQKLAYASGIQIDHATSGYIPTGNPRIAGYKIVGAIQKPDGTWLRNTQSKFVDVNVVVEKTRHKYMGLLESGNIEVGKGQNKRTLKVDDEGRKYVENKVREEEIRMLEFKEAQAETKAYTRLIRALLSLKPYYTAEELKKPFVVVKVSLNINYMLANDQMKQQLVAMAIASQSSMFGLPAPATQHIAHQLPASVEMSDIPLTSAVYDDDDETPEVNSGFEVKDVKVNKEVQQNQADPMEATLDEVVDSLRQQPDAERLTTIKYWLERKQFKPKKGTKDPSKMNLEEQVSYVKYLYSLPEPPKEEALPFP